MGELIQFLDLHSGSLTVLVAAMSMIITLVYVVATIFICRANIRSAEATREQVAEARRQYEEEHRPYISYQIIYERRMFYGMRFTNHGKRVASHVQIDLDKSFVNSIPKETFRVFLNKLRGEEFSLGIGQDYNIYFGAAELFKAYACKCNKCNHFHYWHRFHNFTAIFGKSKLYLDTGSYHCCNSNSLHLHTKEEGFNESNE